MVQQVLDRWAQNRANDRRRTKCDRQTYDSHVLCAHLPFLCAGEASLRRLKAELPSADFAPLKPVLEVAFVVPLVVALALPTLSRLSLSRFRRSLASRNVFNNTVLLHTKTAQGMI